MPPPLPEADSLTPYMHMDPEKHFIGESLPPPSQIVSSGLATIGSSPIPAREDHFHGTGKYVGEVFLWSTATPPPLSLFLLGQAVSRTTYAALFALWGTTFGAGDGSTTFNLLDMRDRFPAGAGNLYAHNTSGGNADIGVIAHSHGASGSTSITINNSAQHQHNLALGSATANGEAVVIRVGAFTGSIIVTDPDNNGFGDLTGDANRVVASHGVQLTVVTGAGVKVNGLTLSGEGVHAHTGSASTSVTVNSAGGSGTNANLPPFRGIYFAVYTGV